MNSSQARQAKSGDTGDDIGEDPRPDFVADTTGRPIGSAPAVICRSSVSRARGIIGAMNEAEHNVEHPPVRAVTLKAVWSSIGCAGSACALPADRPGFKHAVFCGAGPGVLRHQRGQFPAICVNIDRLDYLQWLGIDCIWLPPLTTRRCARPVIRDFYKVLPEFGSEGFRRLVDAAHRRGMHSYRRR